MSYKEPFVIRHLGKLTIVLFILMLLGLGALFHYVHQVGLKNIVEHVWNGEEQKP